MSSPTEQLETVKQLKSRAESLLALCHEPEEKNELGSVLEELRISENKFKALFPAFKLKQEDMDELRARIEAVEARKASL
ncbi:hypothetical protein EON83_17805 [bacterium]|nr:MAG: hypothetical protein EON83_17805 [bacterium]